MSNTILKLKKALPERLRSLGLDEAWLQDQIAHDPTLLGLGELELIKKEKIQSTGSRIDFVMAEPDGEMRYEIEVMLGETDASHIVRTIEYWDTERQRYPTVDHRAVLVAEEITARFFNVIRLLNRAVPMIAIQLSAFRIGDEVVLQFSKVLDVTDAGEEPEDEGNAEPVDRGYWDKKGKPELLAVVDAIRELTPISKGPARVTYNKYHVALGTSGYNFCWFNPRKTYCHVEIKVGPEKRQEIISRLADAGIEASGLRSSLIRLHLTAKNIQAHRDLISDIMRIAEECSHR